jgi:hypothetical protein
MDRIFDIDALHAAQAMVEHYGPHAQRRARARVEERLAFGDSTGAAVWEMITSAIEELTRERQEGESLN